MLETMQIDYEYNSIKNLLLEYSSKPKEIKYAIDLMKECAPHIASIKSLLDVNDEVYLKSSTVIVDLALSKLVEEVNSVVSKKDLEVNSLKSVLKDAWHAILYMHKFDIEESFREERFAPNCKLLHDIIDDNLYGFDHIGNPYFSTEYYDQDCLPYVVFGEYLDISDLDLRTEEELFLSCDSIDICETYIKHFPKGKHLEEVENKLWEMKLDKCRTVTDFKEFYSTCPKVRFKSEAEEKLQILEKEQQQREEKARLLAEAINKCNSLDDVLNLYRQEMMKDSAISSNTFSQKALGFCKTKLDYMRIVSTFPSNSNGVYDAKRKLEEMKKTIKEREEQKKKNLKLFWIILSIIVAFGLLLAIVFLMGGLSGLAKILTIIAVMSGLVALGSLYSREQLGCTYTCVSGILSIICFFAGSSISDFEREKEERREATEQYNGIMPNPSIIECQNYILKYSDSEYSEEIRRIWYDKIMSEIKAYDYYSKETKDDNPIFKLKDFIRGNQSSVFWKSTATTSLISICDSLYDVASNLGTIKIWQMFRASVPSDYYKDSNAKIQELEDREWETEAKAWKRACSENSIRAYTKYKNMYPKGKHITQAEKLLIDLEVANASIGNYGKLPEMDKVSYGNGPTSVVTVHNGTGYTLTLSYSGNEESKKLVIPMGQNGSVTLKNGQYRIFATVNANNVRGYFGMENLTGGGYSASYYIETTTIRN